MAKSSTNRAIKLFGTDEPTARLRTLTAGKMTAVLDGGSLRYIRYMGVEVLRGISFLSRDANWGTYGAAISKLKVKNTAKGFTVSYEAVCRDERQELHYSARIEAADDVIRFEATGIPRTAFLTNRTGFVVLHPLEGIVGAPVEIVHTDGKKQRSRFPKFISPGQPVFEIRSLKHTVMPGVAATVLMEGNKFEMEDHRNWMDASYKTYVCSLLDPWPYTLAKDVPFNQSITLSLAGKPKTSKRAASSDKPIITIGKAAGKLPRLGLGISMAEAKHVLGKAELVKTLVVADLVCQIDGRQEGQAEAALHFAELGRRCGAPVTLEIILPAQASADAEMTSIADAVHHAGLRPRAVVVTQAHDLKSFQPGTPRPWGPSYGEMAKAARSSFPGVPIGGGMLSYFTELNRKPLSAGLFDFVTHTVCPIVHAADDVSVMETLEALPSIFASTRAMVGKLPYHIGPSGISCRANPYGAAVAPNPGNKRVCLSDADPRQKGLFAAAWNLGLYAAAATAKIDAIALGAATGPQGVIEANSIRPVYHLIRGLAQGGSGKRLVTANSAPSKLVALAQQSKQGTIVWLANLTDEPVVAKLRGLHGSARLSMLDAQNFPDNISDADFLTNKAKTLTRISDIELGPYAVAQIVAD